MDFLRAHRDEPTLSVLVEGTAPDPGARRAWRVRLRQALADIRKQLDAHTPDDRTAFERCEADLLQHLPADGSAPSPAGWAYFHAASGESLALSLAQEDLPTTARWGVGPAIVPLLGAARPERALVLMIDLEHATLERWTGPARETLVTLEADTDAETAPKMGSVPRQGFHGGTRGSTRTDDAQRQRASAQERLRLCALEALVTHDDGHVALVIGGAPTAVARLLSALAPTMTDRAVEAPGLGLHTAAHEAREAVSRALDALQVRLGRAQTAAILDAAHSTPRGAFGLAATRAAARLGAIDALLFSEAAYRADPEGVEEVVRHALAAGASVECAPHTALGSAADPADGLAATLRFPVPDQTTTTLQET